MMTPNTTPADDIARIRESAARLGVQLDEEGALQWLAAIAADAASDDHIVSHESGTFGHRVSMLDFTPRDLERFRRIGQVVEVTGPEGVVESALALSGSAAQSKIQSFPGDCDYFQRLNIKAATREEACRIMADSMRAAARRTSTGDAFQFLEESSAATRPTASTAGTRARRALRSPGRPRRSRPSASNSRWPTGRRRS